ncbi:MAG: polynucleotide adenylyltransferase PcnB [Kiritimatiellae bacterium]|nr:polynucleotide adenylyltransferase PcnB [Kiritimatiellia bacterium]
METHERCPAPLQHVTPIIRHRWQHNISRRNIDPDALKVLYRLDRHGYLAYLVGGSVRDLLLGRHPKDFDVATDAHPGTIRKLFSNSFLVGRRFRLVHIRFGSKVIETSTFRRDPDEMPGARHDTIEYRRDDNTFGTPEEDAWRRDFTINGLFYDIRTRSVLDYVGGLEDLERKLIRCIGDPDVRFREDPVRMIRAIRFAARLGFQIEPQTYLAILRHHAEIRKAPAARVLEELHRLFGFNSGLPACRLLHQTRLMTDLLPEVEEHLEKDGGREASLWKLLKALDESRYVVGEPTLPLVLATALWPLFSARLPDRGDHLPRPSPHEVAMGLLRPLGLRLKLPKKIFFRVLSILCVQPRFETSPPRAPSARRRIVEHDFFAEALSLREIVCLALGFRDQNLHLWRSLVHHRLRAFPTNGSPSVRTRLGASDTAETK